VFVSEVKIPTSMGQKQSVHTRQASKDGIARHTCSVCQVYFHVQVFCSSNCYLCWSYLDVCLATYFVNHRFGSRNGGGFPYHFQWGIPPRPKVSKPSEQTYIYNLFNPNCQPTHYLAVDVSGLP